MKVWNTLLFMYMCIHNLSCKRNASALQWRTYQANPDHLSSVNGRDEDHKNVCVLQLHNGVKAITHIFVQNGVTKIAMARFLGHPAVWPTP